MGMCESKKGDGEWKSQICFDPRADGNDSLVYVTDDELRHKLKELVDSTERIEMAYVYKVPLTDAQITDLFLHHSYVILDTSKWWWSIEKNSEGNITSYLWPFKFDSFTLGITIQRVKSFDSVCYKYRQKQRVNNIWNGNSPTKIKEDAGVITLEELIDWLYCSDALNKKYSWKSSNCQHFSNALFKKVTGNQSFMDDYINQSFGGGRRAGGGFGSGNGFGFGGGPMRGSGFMRGARSGPYDRSWGFNGDFGSFDCPMRGFVGNCF